MNSDRRFKDKMLDKMPRFTVSILATMLGFAVTIRIIGIDISTPINNLISAEVESKKLLMQIELEAKKINNGKVDEEIRQLIHLLDERLSALERAHQKRAN